MQILFLGPNTGTSQHRSDALARLGHEVTHVSPEGWLNFGLVLNKFHYVTGGLLLEGRVFQYVLGQIGDRKFDMAWVDCGRLVGPKLVAELQSRGTQVLNLNNDDPYGTRDGNAWRLYLKTVPLYDMVAVVRQENVAEAKARGARKVLRVYMSADEVAHAPRRLTAEDHARWDSEVVFVGTWMPERGPFMAELIERGVPLTIYGNRWQKSPEWPIIRPAWKGPGINKDDDYASAIQCAKICLGLLSKGNRDLHTQRSLEIPALGGLFCAERTAEHQQLYREGEEAAFWDDAAECAEVCRRLLADDTLRQSIAHRGFLRCRENKHYNEAVMAGLIAEASRN